MPLATLLHGECSSTTSVASLNRAKLRQRWRASRAQFQVRSTSSTLSGKRSRYSTFTPQSREQTILQIGALRSLDTCTEDTAVEHMLQIHEEWSTTRLWTARAPYGRIRDRCNHTVGDIGAHGITRSLGFTLGSVK
jgi:hypothetical protein